MRFRREEAFKKKGNKNVILTRADARSLPFSAHSQKNIVSFHCLQMLGEEWHKGLEEIDRVLEKGKDARIFVTFRERGSLNAKNFRKALHEMGYSVVASDEIETKQGEVTRRKAVFSAKRSFRKR